MGARDRIERVLRQDEQGMLTRDDLRAAIWEEIDRARRDGDPELVAAVAAALRHPALPPDVVGHLSRTAFLATLDPAGSPRRETAEVFESLRVRLSASTTLGERAQVLAAIPAQWCDLDLVDATLRAASDQRTRADLARVLLPTLQHHRSPIGAFRTVVEPHLGADDAESIALTAGAYLVLDIDGTERRRLRDHLLARTDALDSETLLQLGIHLSIECHDDEAVGIVDAALRAGLASRRAPVAGIVLWIAGQRERARSVVSDFPLADADWWTQGAESLRTFVLAADAPADVAAELLAPRASEGLVRYSANVGALVARCALLRMRAALARGRTAEAAVEAHAVVFAHGYRAYDLHLQGSGYEFDPRLLDRLAVTPDEVQEARSVAAAAPDVASPDWFVSEGRLIRRA